MADMPKCPAFYEIEYEVTLECALPAEHKGPHVDDGYGLVLAWAESSSREPDNSRATRSRITLDRIPAVRADIRSMTDVMGAESLAALRTLIEKVLAEDWPAGWGIERIIAEAGYDAPGAGGRPTPEESAAFREFIRLTTPPVPDAEAAVRRNAVELAAEGGCSDCGRTDAHEPGCDRFYCVHNRQSLACPDH